MTMHFPKPFQPSEIAFDVDGVVADTMELFVRLGRERYGFTHLSQEDMSCYDLYRCLDMPKETIDDLICLTLDDELTLEIPPYPGAAEVLTELARYGPLKFVTARIWPESLEKWLHHTLGKVPPSDIRLIATGAPEAKLNVLKELGVGCFVEDRIETCYVLARDGVQPILFDQPWNRLPGETPFPRVENWFQLRQFILPNNGNMK